MVVFLNADGSAQKVTPQHVYQGSNNVNEITVIAPFANTTALQIGFVLPGGLYWESSDGARYAPMELMPQSIDPSVSAWHYNLTASLTEEMGELYVAINAVTGQGNTTSYMCKVLIEESVLPNLPDEPDPGVYDLLQLYISRLDVRTANVPNLVATIQKVASNAITYTNNSGVTSAPIVLGGGEDAPLPETTASKVVIPADSWQPTYAADGTTVTGYTYIVTAGLHGQMRDGATANDLWLSFDETDGTALLGTFKRYMVDTAGNITVYVNQPVTLTVRVWNGKALADLEARELVAQETTRAENEEQKLQQQITELQNTGVDTVARAAIAAETERAEAAEESLRSNIDTEASRAKAAEAALQENINAEVSRATAAEEALQTAITELTTQVGGLITVVFFTVTSWDATGSTLYYLGAVNKTVDVPSGKRIVQVIDSNNMPRGTWQGNVIYANEAFAGVAILI